MGKTPLKTLLTCGASYKPPALPGDTYKLLDAVCMVATTKFLEHFSGGYRNKPHRRTWMQFNRIRTLLTYLSLEDSGRLN